jgi:DNA mismatch repair protein MutS
VRYNSVHGYYIEITKTHLDAVPDYYKRQQTLVGKERYTTIELQQLASDIITAQHEIAHVERETFVKIKQLLLEYIVDLRTCAQALAHLDALGGFAHAAYMHRYVRPTFTDDRSFAIQAGRHPVVEAAGKRQFIPNDTYLDDDRSLMIITGPNMGGKSTYLRQVALISIMAQCGSFVPARSAQLFLVDKIFTRIGAGDNVADGKSTFLVEMEETATICSQATERSLVILDEVGRGTSTFDGLAIAQAVIEYIHTRVKARCLFATHYHELHHLTETFPAIVSYHAASSKTRQGIVLLYTILPGVADGSFGIEVAQLARLPQEVIVRAKVLLQELKAQDLQNVSSADDARSQIMQELAQENTQLRSELEQLQQKLAHAEPFVQSLKNINYDELSPKQAFDLVWSYKQQQNLSA